MNLAQACYDGNVELVNHLIVNGHDVNKNYRVNSHNILTPLVSACSQGHIEVVRILLENDADINLRYGNLDLTPLEAAIYFNRIDVVKFLLVSGANVTPREYPGVTLLHIASREGNVAAIKLLLRHGGILHRLSFYGRTPLKEAIDHSQDHVAEYIEQLTQFTALYTLFGHDVARDMYHG